MSGDEQESPWISPWPRKILDWVDLWAKLVLIAGAAFAVYQYLDARRDLRVAKTMEFVERFEDAQTSIGAAQRAISAALRPLGPKIAQLRAARMDLDTASKIERRIVAFLVKDANGGEGLAQSLDTVVGFLETVNVCVREELCETDVASAFFGDYARRFWKNFSPYVTERRQTAPGYGAGLEWFAQSAHGEMS